MINTILFPVDGSANSRAAIDYAENIALKYQAKVILLNVYVIPILYDPYELTPDFFDNLIDKLKEKSLKSWRRKVPSRKVAR